MLLGVLEKGSSASAAGTIISTPTRKLETARSKQSSKECLSALNRGQWLWGAAAEVGQLHLSQFSSAYRTGLCQVNKGQLAYLLLPTAVTILTVQKLSWFMTLEYIILPSSS